MPKFPCPCCGHKTLASRGEYDICPVCFWEDDPEAYSAPEETLGCNGVSLARAQRNYQAFGACTEAMLPHVRAPREKDVHL